MKKNIVKVINIFGKMDRGGAETWMVSVTEVIGNSNIQLDYLVHKNKPGDFDEHLRKMGSNIHVCPIKPRLKYFIRLYQLLRSYDVVHSHVGYFSGVVLLIAKIANVKIRISHGHNDFTKTIKAAPIHKRVYFSLSRWLINRCATQRLACSASAAKALFGIHIKHEKNFNLVSLGLNTEKIAQAPESKAKQSKDGTIQIYHVGRFVREKNHSLLIDISEGLKKAGISHVFNLVGDGPLLCEISEKIKIKKIEDNFNLMGKRTDVFSILATQADLFIFPSLNEGLGLALIEAQALGLPCIYSDGVPCEAVFISKLCRRVNLSSPIEEWVEAVREMGNGERIISRKEAFYQLRSSVYNIEEGAKKLERIYSNA